jgi:uncharacterized protein YukE
MAYTKGMNTDEVRRLAGDLDNQRDNIANNVVPQINRILGELEANWSGPDMQQFKQWWESEHRPALIRLAENIGGLAQSARNNASAQDEASRA